MRALTLFLVLVLAKALALWGQPFAGGLLVVPALFWQDAAVALAFGIVDKLAPRWLSTSLYVATAALAAVDIPVIRALGTPLTGTMLGAAGGALADSMRRYLTAANLTSVAAVVAVATLLPRLLRRAPRLLLRGAVVAGVPLLVAGPLAARRLDTRGLERNAVVALAPRWGSRAAFVDEEAWRVSPLPTEAPPEKGEGAAYRAAAAGKNVVLVILESTGARYLGAYGAEPDPMPQLTKLAARSAVVESAYAVYPESIKGLFATLCSTYPAFDSRPAQYVGYGPPSVAATLRGAGYRTAMFHSGRFAYLGMRSIVNDRGFDLLEDAGDIGGDQRSSFGLDDERVAVRRLLGWIDRAPSERFFAAFLPAAGHHPYNSPPPWVFPQTDDPGRYRNSLRHADDALGELLQGLRERKLDGDTALVVVGDHAEAFGQHPGNFAHSLFLYEENVRVPFVVSVPGRGPVRLAGPASLLDVAPTILDVAAVPAPREYQGASVFEGGSRMALFFTDYSLPLLGLRDGPWKIIVESGAARPKLFHLPDDPEETRNRADEEPERVAAYATRLQRWSAAQRQRLSGQLPATGAATNPK